MKYLFFDVDDTLYRRNLSFINACKEVLPSSFELDYEELYRKRSYYSEYYLLDQHLGKISMEEMYELRLNGALSHFGYKVDRETAMKFEEVYRCNQNHIALDNKLSSLLDGLKDCEVKMGIISNGVSEHQRNKIISLGIDKWIDEKYWVISGDLNCKKPSTEIFEYARNLFGAKPEECFIVGDNADSDIAGGINALWHTIWFNHKGDDENNVKAEYIVHDEDELVLLIKSLFL